MRSLCVAALAAAASARIYSNLHEGGSQDRARVHAAELRQRARAHAHTGAERQLQSIYDVVVYGATPSGIAAAVQASNGTGACVALIEPTSYVGGMAGPGGIGLRDMATAQIPTISAPMRTWLHMNSASYGVSIDQHVFQPDASVGEANWRAVLSLPYLCLDVWMCTGVDETPGSLVMNGTDVAQLGVVDTCGNTSSAVLTALVWVDASYEGDVIARTPATLTYGREARDTYNETLAGVLPHSGGEFTQFTVPVSASYDNGTILPTVDAGPLPAVGSSDTRLMPSSFRLCVSPDTDRVPWPAPAGYDPSDFDLLVRYAIALNSADPRGPSIGSLVAQYAYNGFPSNASTHMRYDLCETGSSAISTDEPTAMYDAYVTGNRSVRAGVIARVQYRVLGMMYTLAHDPRVPAVTRNSTAAWGLCASAWPENGHVPPLMYVREGYRVVGDAVATQNSIVYGQCVHSSIGQGGWTIDVHLMNRIIGNLTVGGRTYSGVAVNEGAVGFAHFSGNGSLYDLPYELLTPRRAEVTNVLVTSVPSSSHIAFASLRVEPTFMSMGAGAGAAAAIAARTRTHVQDVDIRSVQAVLVAAGQCVHWPDCTNINAC